MIPPIRSITILVGVLLPLLCGIPYAAAGTMVNDPMDSGDRIKRYERKDTAPALGDFTVDALHFFTIDGKFARVSVRYHSKSVHDQVLKYLQAQFGPIDRTPGQMARGLNQQFNWRGEDTEIN